MNELLGIALGTIGLRYDDFCRLDFDEFASVYEAYCTERDADMKNSWNQIRTLACITIQPHLAKGKKLSPEKLLPLPWDKKTTKKRDEPELTIEQKRARMVELVNKLGDTI